MSGGSYSYLYQELRAASQIDGMGDPTPQASRLKRMCVDIARAPVWWLNELTLPLAVQAAAMLAEPLICASYVTPTHEKLAKAWEWACSGDWSHDTFAKLAADSLCTRKPPAAYQALHAWLAAEQKAAQLYKLSIEYRG